jgi:hypothetical protein
MVGHRLMEKNQGNIDHVCFLDLSCIYNYKNCINANCKIYSAQNVRPCAYTAIERERESSGGRLGTKLGTGDITACARCAWFRSPENVTVADLHISISIIQV